MKAPLIFALSFLFIAIAFITIVSHALGLKRLILSFIFFLIGGGLYQFAIFLKKKQR
jgi:hypothetical protein